MTNENSRSLVVANIVAKNELATTGQSSIIRRKSSKGTSSGAVSLLDDFLNQKGCCRPMHEDDNTLFYYNQMPSHYVFARGTRLWAFISKANLREGFVDKILPRLVPITDPDLINVHIPELRKITAKPPIPKLLSIPNGQLTVKTNNFIDLFVNVGQCRQCEKDLLIPFFVFEGCAKIGLAPISVFEFCGQTVVLFSDLDHECSVIYFSHLESEGIYNL